MSQSLSLVISQVLRQEQRLTPQLIQSMDILQLPLLALEQRINEELEQNPVLEYEPDRQGLTDAQSQPAEKPESEPTNGDPTEAIEAMVERLRASSERYEPRRRFRDDGEADPKIAAMANAAARPQSLQEHLADQWRFVEVEPEVKRAGETIVTFLEDDGYLRTNFETMAENVKPPLSLQSLEQALPLVQKLEPAGIGARDLPECLLLQMNQAYPEASLAQRIVRDHLQDVAKRRLPAICKAVDASLEQVKEAIEIIGRLQMRPGLAVVDRPVPRVVPDIAVEYDEEADEYRVGLTRGNNPRLRLSPVYLEMYRRRGADRDTRDFLRKQIEAARAIKDAVEYRRERLLQVAKTVVERQRGFLDHGPEHLKVLRMCDLAAEFGCDPSTISRTVDDKYMQTPRGIFSLRYFFTGGTETDNGEAMSWDAVKAKVQQIVDSEDKARPLSDDQIARMLHTDGISVSRRTIAKYRSQLNIPAARQRREY